jgi:heptosyltransferase III
LKEIKKILLIVQRSNGDVFLSSSLVKILYKEYKKPQIDLLVNDDTLSIASLIPNVKNIHIFSYNLKKNSRLKQEKNLIKNIYKNYDLSVSLTSSDRSVIYAILSGKKSISVVEESYKKSWWKKIFLTNFYFFDNSQHILKNNFEVLNLLNINFKNILHPIEASSKASILVKEKLKFLNIGHFFIFHPSTQYTYKIYPEELRNSLLKDLSKLGVPILVTGGNSLIDLEVKKQIPSIPNVINLIGDTSIEEYIELSKLSLCYIGMDTLNMHIASSQNKQIFAIFGPTILKKWSPWSNQLLQSAAINQPIQSYGNVTIFQADMACVACGKAGCDNNFGNSDCLDNISPKFIFNKISGWYESLRI